MLSFQQFLMEKTEKPGSREHFIYHAHELAKNGQAGHAFALKSHHGIDPSMPAYKVIHQAYMKTATDDEHRHAMGRLYDHMKAGIKSINM